MTDNTSVINPQASVYLEKKTLMEQRDFLRKQKKLNDRNHVMKRQRVIHCRSIFLCGKLGYRRRKGYNISQWIRVSAGRGGINDRF